MPDREERPGGSRRPETLAAQALGRVDEATGAIIPPVHPSTTFERAADLSFPHRRSYTRADNPTYAAAAETLTALEGGTQTLLFASGMAAATAVFLSLRPGDHVVAPRVMYWALRSWLLGYAMEWGLDVELADTHDLDALARAVRPGKTRLVWIETPANPLWTVTDIQAAAGIAHGAGARLAVDSTVATPVLTRPLALGADIVMHSATKYLNGHSDVLLGTLTTARDDEYWRRLRQIQGELGGVPGSFESWLLQRGMRTLFARVRWQCGSAMAIARYLAGHARVAEVLYPGLDTHPGHAIAARQMQGGFGGMLSFRIRGGAGAAINVAGALEVWKRATSLGGVESLVEHRASIEGPGSPVPDDLLRLSLGLEATEDLVADLEKALAIASP